jgi:hypothetical protein
MFKKIIVLATILLVIGGFKNAGVAVAIKERGQSDTVTLMSSSEERLPRKNQMEGPKTRNMTNLKRK